ncbi:MAG: addiction module protein [Hyphomicrobiaceae bacterium]|nr:addiction module protein [Hyphomicrobiaceae bacterium]
MNQRVRKLVEAAAALPPVERASLVEGILASLDVPDGTLDAAWAAEARDRLAAYESGELDSHDIDEVLRRRMIPAERQ